MVILSHALVGHDRPWIGRCRTVVGPAGPSVGQAPGGRCRRAAAVPLGVAAAVAIGGDTYYSVNDIGESWFGKRPSSKEGSYELYWTAWQPAILIPVSAALATHTPWERDQVPMLLFAMSVWPLSLSAHGLWYRAPDSRWAPAAMVTMGDGLMATYDAVMLASGERVVNSYAAAESIVGGLQTLYAVGVTSRGFATLLRAG